MDFRRLCLAAFLAWSAVSGARALEFDNFTQSQSAESAAPFASPLGDATRSLNLLGSGSEQISSGLLAVSGVAPSAHSLSYSFDAPVDWTAFDSVVLLGVSTDGNPQILLNFLDTEGVLQSLPMNEAGGIYVASLSAYNLIDFGSIENFGLRFFDESGNFNLTATSIVLTPVPEPGALLLVAAGGMPALFRRRRR